MDGKTYSVEEVSARFNITPRTLHYYEEIGLIPVVSRTEGRHRCYHQAIVDRLEHIIRIKNLMGISLQEISKILQAEQDLEAIKELYYKQDSGKEKIKLKDQAAVLLQSMIGTIEEKINNLLLLQESFKKRLDRVNSKSAENL